MDKAYYPTIWENLPAETSPLDEINLNAISRGLSEVDDRVINLDTRVKSAVNSVTFDSGTGVLRVIKDNGRDFTYNLTSRILNTIDNIQQQNRVSFSEIAVNFQDVRTLLDDMDLKIDMTAEGANDGLRDVQTTIEENDGYYRREMSGIRDTISSVSGNVSALDRYVTEYSSSITQTTQAIQLQVQEVTQSVDDLGNSVNGNMTILRSQINQQAGQISLKVSKLEVIDDLQHEFGSGIQITPDRITFASTGAMVVNTTNFKLDEVGNAEFKGHVAMDSGSVGGVPIIPSPSDSDSTLSVQHAHHSWKLRSAAISGTDERYYTYMTAKKHLITVNSETGGHSAENDVTGNCTIGSPNYPWKTGYFKNLRVCTEENNKIIRHNVIPEGIEITLDHSNWFAWHDCYKNDIRVEGIKPGRTFFSIAAVTDGDLYTVYDSGIEAACIANNVISFISWYSHSDDISLILILEDYVMATVDESSIDGAFDQETNQLSLMWDSIDSTSPFISWKGDTVIIEKYDEANDVWEPFASYTSYEYPEGTQNIFKQDEFSDNPLIIGEEDEPDE